MRLTGSLIIATALLVTVGCSKNSKPEPFPAAISLRGDIITHSRASEIGFDQGDKVGIYIADYTSNNTVEGMPAAARVSNRQHAYGAGNLFAPVDGNPIEWTDQSTKVTVWGIYPFVSSIVDVRAIPVSVKVDQSAAGNYAASDMLMAKRSDVAPSRTPIELSFFHALSKMSIAITKDADNTHELSGLTVMIKTVITDANVDLGSGTVTSLTSKANIIAAPQNSRYEAIIIPQTVSDMVIEITLADQTKYCYTFNANFTFASKAQHDIAINLKKGAAIEIVSNSITQWNPGAGDTGEVFPF